MANLIGWHIVSVGQPDDNTIQVKAEFDGPVSDSEADEIVGRELDQYIEKYIHGAINSVGDYLFSPKPTNGDAKGDCGNGKCNGYESRVR